MRCYDHTAFDLNSTTAPRLALVRLQLVLTAVPTRECVYRVVCDDTPRGQASASHRGEWGDSGSPDERSDHPQVFLVFHLLPMRVEAGVTHATSI